MRYLPPALLEHVELEELDTEEFISFLACARYVQELETGTMARAIAAALGVE